MAAWTRGTVTAALALAAACVDTRDLSGGSAQDAGTCDGANCADAIAPPPPPSDADADASGPAPVFCDDFERDTPLGDWDGVISNNSKVSIDGTTAASGTHSLSVALDATDANIVTNGAVGRVFSLPAGSKIVTLRWSTRIDALPGREIHGPVLQFGATPQSFVNLQSGGARLAEQNVPAGGYDDNLFGGLVPGAWHRVVLTIDGSKKPTHASIDVDAARRLDVDFALDFSTPSPLEVRLGIAYSAGGPAYAIRFDDVCLYAR